MASKRQIILATGEIYHLFNRGVERRVVFTNKREYQRALDVIGYYRFADLPMRFSRLMELTVEEKAKVVDLLKSKGQVEVKVLAFCLMPNHFHLLVKQEKDDGISRFISNISNSYSKYFNTKHKRLGPLFQGAFKAVRVETDEQLIHLSRYIHLNPVSSSMVKEESLGSYPWSSLPEYLERINEGITDSSIVLNNFGSIKSYRKFVYDQIGHAKELEKIKHLTLEE